MLSLRARSIGSIVIQSLLLVVVAAAGAVPPLRVAYFVPSDREIIPGYVERLDRCMTEVQRFYREGMVAAGYGPMTFELGEVEVDLSGIDRLELIVEEGGDGAGNDWGLWIEPRVDRH